MKRFIVLLIVVILLTGCISVSYAAKFSCVGYPFDLTVSLNSEVFADTQNHLEGYSGLLNNIRLKGILYISEGSKSQFIDLNLEIIPVSNPDSSINIRLYGTNAHLLLSSPLLGSETVAINCNSLLEFSVKAYQYLGIPVQYISMLYPYVHELAFKKCFGICDSYFGKQHYDGEIPESEITAFAKELEAAVPLDRNLFYWIEAIGIESGYNEILHEEFSAIAEYIQSSFTGENRLYESGTESGSVWYTDQSEILSVQNSEGMFSVVFNGPVTPWGDLPSLSWKLNRLENADSCSGKVTLYSSDIEADLINLTLNADQIPKEIPSECEMRVSLAQTGMILPEFTLNMLMSCDKDGNIRLKCYLSPDEEKTDKSFLTVSGTVQKEEKVTKIRYTNKEYRTGFDIFAINDTTLPQFIGEVTRPFLSGTLEFLEEIPASAFQSIMDDLTDSGILKILLAE